MFANDSIGERTSMAAAEPTAFDAGIDEPVDGRTLRRTRNRAAVITSLLALIREGDLHPSAAAIADRAGVSHRSIFRYFDDLDDLVRTAIDHAFVEAGPLGQVPDSGNGTRVERITRFVESRIELFESVDGTMQVARMRASSIPSIDEGLAGIARIFQQQIGHHFAAELDELDVDQRSLLVDGLLVLSSYDAYTIQRRLLSSDRDRIRAVMCTAVDALLPA